MPLMWSPVRSPVRPLLLGMLTVWTLLACGASGPPSAGGGPAATVPAVGATVLIASPAGPVASAPPGTSSPTPTSGSLNVSERRPTGSPITIAFGGDVHFEGRPGARLAADPRTALGPIAQALGRADLAMVNLETAVTAGGTPVNKTFVFRAPPSAFVALRAAGVDVATLANNHGMDYGVDGLRDTIAGARSAGFPIVGIGLDDAQAYAPMHTITKGQRIAVIGATQVIDDELVSNWTAGPGKPGLASAKDVPRLLAAVRAARAGSDTVIVYLHWGMERASCPTPAQRALVPQLVEAGADVIVGSHAHVQLGGGWGPDGVYVDYGLGNFVFYASGNGPNTTSGVLTLTVAGRAVTAAEWMPARIDDGVPVPLAGAQASAARSAWDQLRSCADLVAESPRHGPE